MYLSETQIEKFRELWKRRFGKEINKEAAYIAGNNLLNLMRIVYRPISETEYQKLQGRRRQTDDLQK